jgi:hypothetical protein
LANSSQSWIFSGENWDRYTLNNKFCPIYTQVGSDGGLKQLFGLNLAKYATAYSSFYGFYGQKIFRFRA